MERIIKRGDIYYAELNPVIGSEQAQPDGNHCSNYEPSTHKSKVAHTYPSK